MDRHPFGKEHRSVLKSLFDLMVGVEAVIQQSVGSPDFFTFSKLFIQILTSFLRVQMKVFFPLRDEDDVRLVRALLDQILRGLSFPSIPSELLLLHALPCFFQTPDLHPLPSFL